MTLGRTSWYRVSRQVCPSKPEIFCRSVRVSTISVLPLLLLLYSSSFCFTHLCVPYQCNMVGSSVSFSSRDFHILISILFLLCIIFPEILENSHCSKTYVPIITILVVLEYSVTSEVIIRIFDVLETKEKLLTVPTLDYFHRIDSGYDPGIRCELSLYGYVLPYKLIMDT